MMNFFKKIFLCSLVATICLGTAWAETESSKKTIDKIVAIVNQDIILLSDFNEFKAGLAVELKKDPTNHEIDHPEEFQKRVLQQMIEEKLIQQQVKSMGLEATDSQLENVVDEVMKSNGLQNRKELERALRSENITYDQFVEQYKNRIGRSNLVNQTIRPKIKISDDEIQAELQKKNQASSKTVQYRVSMIFLSKANTDLQKMQQLQKTFKTTDDFTKSATQLTEGPGKDAGGDLGWTDPKDLQPALSSELVKLKKGEISPVIQTDTGFYVLACTDQKIKQSDQDEKAKEQVQDEMMNTLLTKNLNQYIADLKRKAHIETFL